MKLIKATSLDNLGKSGKQFQLVFPSEDTIYIYRGNNAKFYMLLTPSLDRIYIENKTRFTFYDIEKLIDKATDEEDFKRLYKEYISEKVIDTL